MSENAPDSRIMEVASEPEQLKSEMQDLEMEVGNQGFGGAVSLPTDLNLNPIAIGLGIENIRYEADFFPGLLYEPRLILEERAECLLVLFENGQLTVVDAPSEQAVHRSLMATVERLQELELVAVDVPNEDDISVEQMSI